VGGRDIDAVQAKMHIEKSLYSFVQEKRSTRKSLYKFWGIFSAPLQLYKKNGRPEKACTVHAIRIAARGNNVNNLAAKAPIAAPAVQNSRLWAIS
jgi:hypothetical protein